MEIRRPHPARMGFTLIELSIVLVIIGLIVAGILTGQSLIRASQLRSVITDVEHYTTAVATFQTKYNCIPGDCPKAEAFFGVNANGCPNGDALTGSCNGNGDGRIDFNGVITPYETFRAWQQLAQGGLVSGTFTGMESSLHAIINTNVPSSHIAGVGYVLGFFNIGGNGNPWWNMKDTGFTNRIVAGRECNNQLLCGAFATPYESYDMDMKMDDGNPSSGRMTVLKDGYSSPDYTPLGSCAWSAGDPNTLLAADTLYNTYNSHPGTPGDPSYNQLGPVCIWVFKVG